MTNTLHYIISSSPVTAAIPILIPIISFPTTSATTFY